MSKAALDGDIDENGTADILRARMVTGGGTWWIEADFHTHDDHENWSVGVMCLNRAYADRYQLRTERVETDARGPSRELPGIPSGYFCGVVGMFVSGGDIEEGGSSNDILNACVRGDPSTGVWDLTADFRTHGGNEIWYVDVLCLYDNRQILRHDHLSNFRGGEPMSTGIDGQDFACGVVGMDTHGGDINEGGDGDILQVYTFIGADGKWYVMADFRTHNSHEWWDVDLLCVRRSAAEVQGNWNGSWVR